MSIFYFLILWYFVTTPDKLTINLTAYINFFWITFDQMSYQNDSSLSITTKKSNTTLMKTWLWRRSKSNIYPFLKWLRLLSIVADYPMLSLLWILTRITKQAENSTSASMIFSTHGKKKMIMTNQWWIHHKVMPTSCFQYSTIWFVPVQL